MPKYEVSINGFSIIVFDLEVKTKEDIETIKHQIELLENSIQRRKNLLSNSNYLSKAPSNLVLEEKKKLSVEIEMVAKLRKEIF